MVRVTIIRQSVAVHFHYRPISVDSSAPGAGLRPGRSSAHRQSSGAPAQPEEGVALPVVSMATALLVSGGGLVFCAVGTGCLLPHGSFMDAVTPPSRYARVIVCTHGRANPN